MKAVADPPGNCALVGARRKPVLKPGFQRLDERPGLRLTDSAAFIGTATADPVLDRVQRCKPLQRLMRDRCRAALVDLDKSATPVRPAKGQRCWTAVALRIGQLLIDRVSVAMNNAGTPRNPR